MKNQNIYLKNTLCEVRVCHKINDEFCMSFFQKAKNLLQKFRLVFILCWSTCDTFAKGLMDKVRGTLLHPIVFSSSNKKRAFI
jgi:hypothetical protein